MEECSLIVTSGNYAKQESIAESLTLSLQSSYIIWAAVFTAEQRCCISSLHVVYCHNTEWLTEVWPLGSYLTVFQSELDAIGKLAVDLCKWNITNTKVIIHCDLKATIMSLEMAMAKSKIVLSTRSPWCPRQWKDRQTGQTWLNNPQLCCCPNAALWVQYYKGLQSLGHGTDRLINTWPLACPWQETIQQTSLVS